MRLLRASWRAKWWIAVTVLLFISLICMSVATVRFVLFDGSWVTMVTSVLVWVAISSVAKIMLNDMENDL